MRCSCLSITQRGPEVAAGSRAGGGGGEVAAGTLGSAGVGLVVELSEESAVGGSGAIIPFEGDVMN
jgi:hypothetical protein